LLKFVNVGRLPGSVVTETTECHAQQQRRGRPDRPWLLAANHAVLTNLRRKQIRLNGAFGEALNRKPITGRETQDIVLERRCIDDSRTAERPKPVELDHGLAEILRKISLQPRQLHGVAQTDDATDFCRPIDVAEISQRALNFRKQVVEHRSHGLKYGLGVLRLCGVALQMLGLGEGELQLLGQCLGEVTTAQWDAPLPNAIAVAHHKVRRVRAQRQQHHRFGRILGIVFLGWRKVGKQVEDAEVVQRQGS